MANRIRSAVVVATLVLVTAACGDDDGDEVEQSARRTATTAANRLEATTRLTATLDGSSEVPAPGDPDGAGRATVNLDVSKRQVCFEVFVERIDRPVGMHVHEGEAGKSGPVVVPLTTPTATDTTTTGCADAEGDVMGRIAATPRNFYVNVHSDRYPQGAVRGQLSQ